VSPRVPVTRMPPSSKGVSAGTRAEQLIIAVDSREQHPYRFPNSVVKALRTGDYSIAGLEDEVTVERKSKRDAYNSLGESRARFRRELERMTGFRYAAIVVEATIDDLLTPPVRSRMNPSTVIRSLLGWSVRYGVPVFFAGSRIHGSAIVRNILEKYWRYRQEGVIGLG
jgi:ERCC4-type nuclease